MIIVSITLHNFMSYGDSTLDLASVPVACLAGDNGAGKSALLDAITWALWECARSSSDEMMRIGEREMWVDLRFMHETHIYRVRRSRTKSASKSGARGTSKGTLEFQIFTGGTREFLELEAHRHSGENGANGAKKSEDEPVTAGGSWRSLTGSSMRDTQRHICELLRMDYDTFINSAYLRQGKVDEFTTRPPSERKQVLGEILGLSYFDRLQEQAREHARNLKARREALELSLSTMPDIKERLSQTEEDFKQSADLLAEVSAGLTRLEEKEKNLSEKLSKLSLAGERLATTSQKIADYGESLAELKERKEEVGLRLSNLDTLLSESPEIEAQARLYDELKSSVEALDQKALTSQELNEKRLELQSELAKMRSRLELKHESLEARISELRTKKERLLKDTHDREKIEETHAQYRELLARETDLSQKQEAFTQLSQHAGDLTSAIQEARIRLEAQQAQKEIAVADLESILTSKNSLSDQDRALKDEVAQLERLEAEFELTEQKGLEVKSELEGMDAKMSVLASRQKENLEKIRELKEHDHSSICPLCCAPIVDRKAVIDRYLKLNEEMDAEIDRLKDHKGDLETNRNELRKQYIDLKKRLEARKDLDKRIGQLNEKQLAVARAEENLDRAKDELKEICRRLTEQDFAQIERESLVSVRAEIHKLDFDAVTFSSLKAQVRAQRHIESRHQQLKKDLVELERLNENLPALEEELAQIASELKGETYGQEVRASLSEVKSENDRIAYDRQSHMDLKQRLNELIPALDKVRDLRRAVEEKPQAQKSFDECLLQIENKSQLLKTLLEEERELRQQLSELPEMSESRNHLVPLIENARLEKETTSRRVAVLESQCHAMVNELKLLNERQSLMKEIESDIDDYTVLAESFGKKGIQAVIIENAVPEIESDANRILSRLTDSKMHVGLVTQHKTKAGSMVETLDLLIGDELGTRNYELYSGGEAFKVNFAIRVALSRLLARRSGAKLETLIIDEGFGSQDEISRDRLVKAIRSIQSDFARIIVITHISDIKEMFPVQIQVTKRNGTSQLQLLS